LETNEVQKLLELKAIIIRLRAPDGCPWDIKQTPLSFKKYILEEARELAEAIDQNDDKHILEELGDLLFQVMFVNNLYEEQGKFTFSDVIDSITEKMIRRHPHVFGDATITCEQDLREQWQRIKAGEQNICLNGNDIASADLKQPEKITPDHAG